MTRLQGSYSWIPQKIPSRSYCKIPFLPPPHYSWHQHPRMHASVSNTVSVLLFYICCLAGGDKASDGITALGSDLQGSDEYHQTAQESWHTSKSNSTGAMSCRRNHSHSSYVKLSTMIGNCLPSPDPVWMTLPQSHATNIVMYV